MGVNASDMDLIQQAVQHYFDGLYHSDLEELNRAFHPNAQVIGYFQGNLLFHSLDQFLELVKGTPAPSGHGEAYDMKIVSIDVTGNQAVAKVADLYLGFRFTDYLSLLNIDGDWKIVNKVFYHEAKE